jgi:tRNA threonylcarbamoyl adenosine modification protein YeaZ
MPNSTNPKKYFLALHTSTPELGLAISNFGGDSRCQVWNLERNLSNLVHEYLIDFIKPQAWKDLGFIAVAKGPGGFTGTRIGVVIARTLGQQLDIPIFGISNLGAIALHHHKLNNKTGNLTENQVYALEMPAQRGQIFGGIYSVSQNNLVTNIMPDTVMSPNQWQQAQINHNQNHQLIECKSGLAASVTSVLQLAYNEWLLLKHPHWSEVLPFYGQHPVDV